MEFWSFKDDSFEANLGADFADLEVQKVEIGVSKVEKFLYEINDNFVQKLFFVENFGLEIDENVVLKMQNFRGECRA